MTSLETIISTIKANMKPLAQHIDYPNKPGLYAFVLAANAMLGTFGSDGQIVYVGKAEESLNTRDLNTHFKDNGTGRSSLRRSIGAILKNQLGLIAFSRNGTLDNPNIDNYRFDLLGEGKLSQWMKENLLIGYWKYNSLNEQELLRNIEERLIIKLKPTLDLDRRTYRFNSLADQLKQVREVCKREARNNVLKNVAYY